jgi:transketolase
VIASSIKHFDDTLTNSIRKTKKVVTVEDHNIYSGLGNQIARHIVDNQLSDDNVQMLGVRDYELSGTAEALYEAAGISAKQIATTIGHLLTV